MVSPAQTTTDLLASNVGPELRFCQITWIVQILAFSTESSEGLEIKSDGSHHVILEQNVMLCLYGGWGKETNRKPWTWTLENYTFYFLYLPTLNVIHIIVFYTFRVNFIVRAMMKKTPLEDNMVSLSSFRCCYCSSPSNQIVQWLLVVIWCKSPISFLFVSTKCLWQLTEILLYVLATLFKLI